MGAPRSGQGSGLVSSAVQGRVPCLPACVSRPLSAPIIWLASHSVTLLGHIYASSVTLLRSFCLPSRACAARAVAGLLLRTLPPALLGGIVVHALHVRGEKQKRKEQQEQVAEQQRLQQRQGKAKQRAVGTHPLAGFSLLSGKAAG